MKKVIISILQLKDSKEKHYLSYASLSEVKAMELEVKKENYQKVYSFEMEIEQGSEKSILDKLFAKFQGVKPEGYTGHSLSVSDMIEVDGTCYYVDNYGFERINF